MKALFLSFLNYLQYLKGRKGREVLNLSPALSKLGYSRLIHSLFFVISLSDTACCWGGGRWITATPDESHLNPVLEVDRAFFFFFVCGESRLLSGVTVEGSFMRVTRGYGRFCSRESQWGTGHLTILALQPAGLGGLGVCRRRRGSGAGASVARGARAALPYSPPF